MITLLVRLREFQAVSILVQQAFLGMVPSVVCSFIHLSEMLYVEP
jgi:hypothetical protein